MVGSSTATPLLRWCFHWDLITFFTVNRFGKTFLSACVGVFIAGATVCGGASNTPPAKAEVPAAPPAFPAFPSFPGAEKATPTPAAEKDSEIPADESASTMPDAPGEPSVPSAETDEKAVARKNVAGRYSVILVRNPFGLNPPPPPPPAEPPPPPEPEIDIKLAGLTTLLGQQRAFLKTIDPTKKEKNETYYSLKVGESKDGLEIVAIDIDLGTVTIRHKDIEKELNMKDDGLKPKTSTANLTPAQAQQQAMLDAKNKQQAALLAARQLPPGFSTPTKSSSPANRVTPTSLPSATRAANGYNRTTTRPPTISSPNTGTVRPNGVQQLPTATRNLTLPGGFERPIRSSSGPLLPPPPVIDTVQQELQIEVNREVNKIAEERDGLVFPPLPPTTQR